MQGSTLLFASARLTQHLLALPQDEANRLRQWTDAPERLTNLLAFFARVSKQENSAHVVLATSDGAFASWLGARNGAPRGQRACAPRASARRAARCAARVTPAPLPSPPPMLRMHNAAGMNPLFFSTLYLADVPEDEARAYFFDHGLRRKPAAAAALRACPDAWPLIFKA